MRAFKLYAWMVVGTMTLGFVAHAASFVGFFLWPQAFYWRAWEWFDDFPYASQSFESKWDSSEEGDISWFYLFLYKDSVPTHVTADELGFRTTPIDAPSYEIAIAGDSTIWGSGLSDDETLPYLVAEKLGKPVYNASRTDLENALLHPALKHVRLIVDGRTERKINGYVFQSYGHVGPTFRPLANGTLGRWQTFMSVRPKRYSPVARLSTVPDRLSYDLEAIYDGPNVDYLYLEHRHTPADLESAVRHIAARKRWLASRGIRYVFLPIPAKQTLYKGDVDPYTRRYLHELIRVLSMRGVEVIDIVTPFEAEKKRGLFQRFDTHWNADGVRLAADVVVRHLK